MMPQQKPDRCNLGESPPQDLSFPTSSEKQVVRPVLTFLEPKCGAERVTGLNLCGSPKASPRE